jgi:predicted signal transduction protein with EAL and GGDEF domain
LRDCARDVDTVARVGGDEFVVLQANAARPEEVAPLARRILQVLNTPYDVNGNPVTISASIGVAIAPFDGASTDELLSHADLALYRAKAKGRNEFCFFDMEMGEVELRRGRLELELRDALARDEFELWYQPWLNITNRQIVGCEALLRWRHPTRGLISPTEFIPIAEESGLIGRLGDWVLRRACRDAATWPQVIKLAVNLSAAQFIGGNLYETVLNTLVESGLEAERLELEITETLIIEDYEGARETLGQLRGDGISIRCRADDKRGLRGDCLRIDQSWRQPWGQDHGRGRRDTRSIGHSASVGVYRGAGILIQSAKTRSGDS